LKWNCLYAWGFLSYIGQHMFGFCFGKNNNCILQGESEFKCQISMFVKIYIMFDGGSQRKKHLLKVFNLQWNVMKLYIFFWTFNVMKFASMWPHHPKGSLNNTNGWGPTLYPNILCANEFVRNYYFSFMETLILNLHFLIFTKLHA
jgi:hypothetical protein